MRSVSRWRFRRTHRSRRCIRKCKQSLPSRFQLMRHNRLERQNVNGSQTRCDHSVDGSILFLLASATAATFGWRRSASSQPLAQSIVFRLCRANDRSSTMDEQRPLHCCYRMPRFICKACRRDSNEICLLLRGVKIAQSRFVHVEFFRAHVMRTRNPQNYRQTSGQRRPDDLSNTAASSLIPPYPPLRAKRISSTSANF